MNETSGHWPLASSHFKSSLLSSHVREINSWYSIFCILIPRTLRRRFTNINSTFRLMSSPAPSKCFAPKFLKRISSMQNMGVTASSSFLIAVNSFLLVVEDEVGTTAFISSFPSVCTALVADFACTFDVILFSLTLSVMTWLLCFLISTALTTTLLQSILLNIEAATKWYTSQLRPTGTAISLQRPYHDRALSLRADGSCLRSFQSFGSRWGKHYK